MGFNSAFKGLIAQPVSSDTLLIIRSSRSVIAASGFTYVAVMAEFELSSHSAMTATYIKPEAAITLLELLMMSGVSLETC